MNITVKMSNSVSGRTSKAIYYVTVEESTGDAMITAECYAANDNKGTFDNFEAINPRKR